MHGPDQNAEVRRPIGSDIEEDAVGAADQDAGKHDPAEEPKTSLGSNSHGTPPRPDTRLPHAAAIPCALQTREASGPR